MPEVSSARQPDCPCCPSVESQSQSPVSSRALRRVASGSLALRRFARVTSLDVRLLPPLPPRLYAAGTGTGSSDRNPHF
ncbi:hypothetical protein KFK09_006536 [Dendrobium nobile]|uniref:Uncharacterized protein n=1 Tax=Dendrobium nobile TaxID=94219 RepID=A0A8T3BSN8_DENNO|nr:hypothetical protein KFK09_006536 [Dendrobium nobile]